MPGLASGSEVPFPVHSGRGRCRATASHPRGSKQSMYAVIETGGKQYRVEVGTELEVELLKADAGETVAFDRVLLIADGDSASIGTPVVANGSVAGEILRRDRGEKLISFKYRPKAR